MWTGDKVISKIISDESLEDINEVLKRKCVIWDNEHANDYDQKRVFLGIKCIFLKNQKYIRNKVRTINFFKALFGIYYEPVH